MENHTTLNKKLILGGALLGAFLVLANVSPMPIFEWMRMMRISTAEAYDKENTHPALTAGVVDFYNLNFSDKKITEEEKQWLIKGSMDEDTLERPLYHFYDPVYNRGIAGISSKNWATKDGTQAAYYNSQFTGFAAISGGDSANDFSYQRALRDYAKGDRKRAFVAFGHTLHLLEDAGVPDHTRNDAHPSFVHGQESPYESEMAKWSPENFNVARSLFLRREKPTSLVSMERYFDRIADYSNSNFFSKDTINNETYSKPNTTELARLTINGWPRLFIVNKDKNGQIFPIALLDADSDKELKSVLISKKIGSYILDGYWERLSKEVVVSGAGALKLFLEEGEKARQEYLAKAEQKKPSFWAQVVSLLGFGGNDEELATSEGQRTSDVNDGLTTPDGRGTSGVNDDGLATSEDQRTSEVRRLPVVTDDGDSGDTNGDKKVSPSLSPVLSPKPSVSPLVSLSPSPVPKLSTTKKTGGVVINEIAWAGTSASANDEWIELYNAENYDIDISGWTLKAEDGTPDITIEEGKVIKAQSYFLLERTDDTTVNSVAADQLYTGALGNEGEYLKLSDSSGIVVGIAGNSGESWSAGSSIGKYSMERTDSGGPDASAGVNWKNFTGNPSAKDANGNFINGTPKAANSAAVVIFSSGGGGGGSSLSPTPTPSPDPEGGTDSGDTASSGDVVINEIAWMGSNIGGTANQNANAEWVELYNTTDKTIDLTDWTLAAQDGTPSITASGSIGPFDYYLLERTSDDSVPGIVADQIYTGALGNGGEYLVLKDVSGTTIDQVDGSNGWKLNGDDEIIGDNNTKETAQKINGNWVTAEPTPKDENQTNPTAQAPSAVTNLAASHNSPTITATWSTPDPGTYSPASLSYDMRYSVTVFTETASASWWSGATQVASSSLPSVGVKGASQSASFAVAYEYGQTLYFGLKTKVINSTTCEVVHCSGVSNLASVSWPGALDDGAWGMFGKDQYHTSLANIAGPDPTATTSWEFDVAAEFGSDYAISQLVADGDGNIYFGAADGSSGKLVKLNKNGVKQWEYGTNVSIGTPAVLSDKTVYFGRVGAGGVLAFTALNPDGSKKWDYDNASTVRSVAVSSKGEPHFTYTSGTDKLLVLNTDGSAKTTVNNSGLAGFAPVVLDDGTIITSGKISGNQQFTAYSATGSQSWQVFSSPETYGHTPADPSYDKSTGKTYSAAGPKLFSISSNGSMPEPATIAPFNYTAATTVAVSADTFYLGFNSPGSGSTTNEGSVFVNDASSGTEVWNNPQRASVGNGSYATTFLNLGQISQYLKATGFTLNIPENAVINGIEVQILKSNSCVCMKDNSIKLVKNGVIGGEDRANTSVWLNPDAYTIHGGASDLWGLSLTPDDINASNFGVVISAQNSLTGTSVAGIDNIKITVYYTEPPLLYALNKSDLSAKWPAPFQADGLINKQIVVDNAGNVYFSTQNSKLYRVDTAGAGAILVNSGSNSAISPVLTEHGLVWSYGSKVVVISD